MPLTRVVQLTWKKWAVLAQKSMKWVQMQKKRYGEKRRGGYVDMGKQVRRGWRTLRLLVLT